MADLGRSPLPLLRGLCHFGLVEKMVDQYKSRKESYNDFPPIDATCHITQHADLRDKANWSRQKATGHKQLGKREGVYLDVFTLRWGEFLWIVGL